jgi:hypothetical protein
MTQVQTRLNRRQWLLGLTGAALLSGCQSPKQTVQGKELQRFVFHKGAMGTVFTITLYAADETTGREAAG